MEEEKVITYPKSVFFIVTNEFCERFCYYGMRTVLYLYLTQWLLFDNSTATILYHLFTMFCYASPILGAIAADSFFGKFKTIFYLSLLYAAGNVILSVSSIGVINIPHREFSLLGLLLIAFGTGGIKPCVSAFGGDQFILPQQELQLQQFFSIFYFAINTGSVISTFLTPIFRQDVKCFGENTCFPLAFGLPSALMITSVVIFVCGKSLYVIKEPKGNVIVRFFRCAWNALTNKCSSSERKGHWLDYADKEKFPVEEIFDFKLAFRVLYLYLPLPLFWALFDQQGSKWTYQAEHLDGRIGPWTIKPDQMQVLNPLLILAFIPLFEAFVYPTLRKCGIKRPLQKMTIGGLLASAAFLYVALLEFRIEALSAVRSGLLSPEEAQFQLYSSVNCSIELKPPVANVEKIPAFGSMISENLRVPFNSSETREIVVNFDSGAESCRKMGEYPIKIQMTGGKVTLLLVGSLNGVSSVFRSTTIDLKAEKDDGLAKIIIFDYGVRNDPELPYNSFSFNDGDSVKYATGNNEISLRPKRYQISRNGTRSKDFQFESNRIYVISVHSSSSDSVGEIAVSEVRLFGNDDKIHMLWQLPAIILITAGEIFFSITGLEFSFTQAPETMKSVMSAAWLLTVAIGNLIVVLISEIRFFENQAYEFALYGFLMLVDMAVFVLLCRNYKYVDRDVESEGKINYGSNDKRDIGEFTSTSTLSI